MRIITRNRLREFARRYPDAADALQKWELVVRDAELASIQEMRRVFPHADAVTVASGNTVTVFNVRGNKYRLIAALHYYGQRVYILRLLTHAESSKGFWKDDL